MTGLEFATRSLRHYWRAHAAVCFGVAVAVAVLGGAALVGRSVTASLADLTTRRLGRTSVVISAETPFTEALASRMATPLAGSGIEDVALFVLPGTVTHQASGRRAQAVTVYGVDSRFFAFHHVTNAGLAGSYVLLSPDLATELGAARDDDLVLRVAKPSAIPLDSLQARRDAGGKSIRLSFQGSLSPERMGEFSLAPGQAPVRAMFVALPRLQRDLDQADRVNTLLLAAPDAASPALDTQIGKALRASIDDADLQLYVDPDEPSGRVIVSTSAGVLPDAVVSAATSSVTASAITPLMTWLANRMSVGDRSVPYSLVSAIGPTADGDAAMAALLRAGGDPPIVLNDWAARDLHATAGEPLEIEYYRWTDAGSLTTERATFRVAGVVPMRGLGADRRLTPNYPGITSAASVADWDPPFPIDLKLVRPIDEDYWRQYRTAPKAFIRLDDGQRLWRTRHGQVSSLRIQPTAGADLVGEASRVRDSLVKTVDPLKAGFTSVAVRRQNVAASVGATDFGAYFSYFSAFVMVAALLLTATFFRLAVEQRARETGLLRAAGLRTTAVRRLFLIEASIVLIVGALIGMLLAVAWSSVMLYGLRTWWVDAVRTTNLSLHVEPGPLIIGAASGIVAGLIAIVLAIRGLGRVPPRELISGASEVPAIRTGRATAITIALTAVGLVMAALGASGRVPQAAAFFTAGALLLAAGLAAFRRWLGRARRMRAGSTGYSGVIRLGIANASWRPGRSLACAGLVAAAVFLLVSVDAFRKRAADDVAGSGGFALVGDAVLPIVHDPSTPDGRRALGLDAGGTDRTLAGVTIVPARLRPGDEAGCLNLYKPARPRIAGVGPAFFASTHFRFGAALDRDQPWRPLSQPDKDGAIPAIVDATSLEYTWHVSVGDLVNIDTDTAHPITLRIVAALDDSMLQSEVLIADDAFTRLFPDLAGYRMLFVELDPAVRAHATEIAATLEDRLEAYGLDLQTTESRLDSYHRVENTYLSTFQALGGLGLVLGTLGLAAITARNVVERRRELALVSATGFDSRRLQLLVAAEQVVLVVAGLGIGLVAAAVAIAPVLVQRVGGLPSLPLVWIGVVLAVGLLSAAISTRAIRRLPLVASLRSE